MVKLSDMRIGSTINVRGCFGSGKHVLATVVTIEEDIKNGRPGIDYETEDGDGDLCWAYLEQVDKVIEY